MWLNSEGEQMLKESDAADSLVGAEKALQQYDLLLAQARVRQHCRKRDLTAFHVIYQPPPPYFPKD